MNKQIALTTTALITSLVILFSAVAISPRAEAAPKKVSIKNYQECKDKFKLDDLSKIRNKINDAGKKRINKLESLEKRVNKRHDKHPNRFPVEHKNALLEQLGADKARVNDLVSEKSTDINVSRDIYCRIIFELQTFSFRPFQVSGVIAFDSLAFVGNKYSQINIEADGLLKADIEARTTEAKNISADVGRLGTNFSNQLLAEQKDVNGSTLTKERRNSLMEEKDRLKSEINKSYRLFTEALALKQVDNKFNDHLKLKAISIELKDKDGKVLGATDNAKKARKATVVVSVQGEGNKTVELSRKDSAYKWR